MHTCMSQENSEAREVCKMKNILSYQPLTRFTGKEILDWAKYHVENNTSHAKQGKRILRLYEKTLNPTRMYYVLSNYETAGCGDFRHEPIVLRAFKTVSQWMRKNI